MISKPKIPYVHWGFIYKILPTLQIGRVPFRACVITVIQASLVFYALHDANPLCHTHLSTFSRKGVCYHSHPRSPDVLFTAQRKSSEPHTPQYVPQEGRVLSVIQAALVFCSLHDANPLCHTHLSTFSRRGVCYHSHPSSPGVLFTARCKSSVPHTPQHVQQEGRVLSQSSKQSHIILFSAGN